MHLLYNSDGRPTVEIDPIDDDPERDKANLAEQVVFYGAAGAIPFGGSGAGMYVKDGELWPREENPVRLEGLSLVGLEAPCDLYINDDIYEIPHGSDDRADLSFSLPGKYRVVIRKWPYLDKEFSIEN